MSLSAQYLFMSAWLYYNTVKKYGLPIFKGAPALGLRIARQGIPLVLSVILTELTLRADRILIEKYLGETALGLYHAAFNLIYLPREALIIPLVTAVYNRMCFYHAQDRSSFVKLFEKVNVSHLLIALPLASLSSIFPEEIIRFLYGAKYLGSSQPFAILIWLFPFLFFVTVWQTLFIIKDRTRTIFWVNLSAACLSLGLNFILIPRFGIAGSAWTALLTQIFTLALIFFLLRREPLFGFVNRAARIVPACGAAAILISWLKPENPGRLTFFGLFAAGALLNFVFLYVFRAFSEEEFTWLKNQFRAAQEPLREALGIRTE